MNQPPPVSSNPRAADAEHLNLLAIFHFIGAGLALIALLFLGVQFALIHAVTASSRLSQPDFQVNVPQGVHHINQLPAMPPPAGIEFVLLIFAILALWLFASLILNMLSGWFLLKRRHRTFSIVVACLNCLHIPVGTILGVFTLVVLVRESVRELYEAQQTLNIRTL